MLNIIDAMSYFSSREKATILQLLLTRASQTWDDEKTLRRLIKCCPLDDFSAFPDDIPIRPIIFGLGDAAVAEWIPQILQELTGDEPAEADEDLVKQMQEDMWKEEQITHPMDNPVPQIATSVPETKLGRWEIIFRSYDPVQGKHHYRMLRCDAQATGRALSSYTGGMGMQDELPLISREWKEVSDRLRPYHQHFQTPVCEEEAQIIQDLIRRNGPFDQVFLLGFQFGHPNPSRKETIQSSEFKIQKERHFSRQGLTSTTECHVQTDWPGGVSLLQNNQAVNWHAFEQRSRRNKESWQTAAFWKVEFSQVFGEDCDIPLRWSTTTENQQRFLAQGGQRGIVSGRSGLFMEMLQEQQFVLGTGFQGLSNTVHAGVDSHHMSLLKEDPVDLRPQSSVITQEQRPTIRQTPTIRLVEQNDDHASGTGNSLQCNTVIEQSSSTWESDPTLASDHNYRNTVCVAVALELKWGTEKNGFSLRLPSQSPLAVAQEYVRDSEQVQSIDIHVQGLIEQISTAGTLHLHHSAQQQEYTIQFTSYNNRATFSQSYVGNIKRELGWINHFEPQTSQEQVKIDHSLVLNRTSVGVQLRPSNP